MKGGKSVENVLLKKYTNFTGVFTVQSTIEICQEYAIKTKSKNEIKFHICYEKYLQ